MKKELTYMDIQDFAWAFLIANIDAEIVSLATGIEEPTDEQVDWFINIVETAREKLGTHIKSRPVKENK